MQHRDSGSMSSLGSFMSATEEASTPVRLALRSGARGSAPPLLPAPVAAQAADKAGWLLKKSDGLLSRSVRRWCVVTRVPQALLYYYETPQAPGPKGVIELDGATSELTLTVRSAAERTFSFQGLPGEDAKGVGDWFHALTAAAAAAAHPAASPAGSPRQASPSPRAWFDQCLTSV